MDQQRAEWNVSDNFPRPLFFAKLFKQSSGNNQKLLQLNSKVSAKRIYGNLYTLMKGRAIKQASQ